MSSWRRLWYRRLMMWCAMPRPITSITGSRLICWRLIEWLTRSGSAEFTLRGTGSDGKSRFLPSTRSGQGRYAPRTDKFINIGGSDEQEILVGDGHFDFELHLERPDVCAKQRSGGQSDFESGDSGKSYSARYQ